MGTSVLHWLEKETDKNFPHEGIQASVSDSRVMGYLLRVRSIILLFPQLSAVHGCGAASGMRSGHLGQDRDTSPGILRPLMQFMFMQPFGYQHWHFPGQGVKFLQCHCHRATSSWSRVVSLPSVTVLVGDTASCACLPEGAWVCVDVGTLAIILSQPSYF